MTWPERFLEAIAPGADLSQVWAKFAIWLLNDEEHGVIKCAKTDRTRRAVSAVVNLYLRSLKEPISFEEWVTVRKNAAAAYAAARRKARIAQSEKLLELLREAK